LGKYKENFVLDNCKYNKIKLLHELSRIVWFLDKCGIKDAETSGDTKCVEEFKLLRSEVEKHIRALEGAITE
jgi:hypothetical protein